MRAITGTGTLKGCGHPFLTACCKKRQGIPLPRLLVEIGGQEPARLVRHERIDASDERLCLSGIGDIAPLKMASHHCIGNGHEVLVWAIAALDPGFLTNAANPLVVACRSVPRLATL